MRGDAIPIEAQRLSKAFGNRRVLNELSLRVSQGEAVSIVGGNGTGKTTLLRCLSGSLRSSSGAVLWFGHSPFGNPRLRQLVGTMGHESGLYPHLTVAENLVFAARMCGVSEPISRVAEWICSSELAGQGGRLVREVSRGMQQRAAILRALIHDPQILLLDEPSAGLDAAGTDWLAALLRQHRSRGRAICFATHDERLTELLADRVYQVRSGRLHEIGTMQRDRAA